MTSYLAKWPVLNASRTMPDLIALATDDLGRMLTAADLIINGPIEWDTDEQGDQLVLTALVPVRPAFPEHQEPPVPRATARLDDALWLIESGEPPAAVAQRLGIKPGSVARLLARHDMYEKARPFFRLAKVVDPRPRRAGVCGVCGAATSRAKYARCARHAKVEAVA